MRAITTGFGRAAAQLLFILLLVAPVFAQEAAEEAAAQQEPLFRWINFALIAGAFIYIVRKFGTQFFRSQARAIAGSIHKAADERAAAEKDLKEAADHLAALDLEIQDLRRAAATESTQEADRLRQLTETDATKIQQAARAEIAAAERTAAQVLRVIAARVATERAAALIRSRMNEGADAALFRMFLGELEASAR